MSPTMFFDDRELVIVASALEALRDQTRQALKGVGESVLMRPVHEQLSSLVIQIETLLRRIADARTA